MKFFKRPPKRCSMCNEEKPIVKSMRKGLTSLHYCNDCYEGTYKKIEDRVKEQVMEAAKAGKMLSIQDALELTKKVTAEIEAEKEVEKNGKKETSATSEIKSK